MSKVVGVWAPQNLKEWMAAMVELEDQCMLAGHHPETVYPNKLRLVLVEETLTDGSKVMNFNFFDGERG